ncbi:death-associated inhibitor of apoptosis 2 [Anticarsia gemmatalis]|uniref:death-associated inhibitor of apoptosis 2 n=1 Tax=Anticarsia gemmatalis TaxID=129554 RepID=UPI003F765692
MNYEINRLNTFNNWPTSAPVDPIRIAKAGFFYTGDGIEVQCFSCGGKISQWNYGDQVMWRHRRLDPNCPFMVNPQISGNVPLVLGPECPSVGGNGRSVVLPNERRTDSVDSAQEYGPTEEDEMYKSDALRLLSFANWDDTSVSREALVSAGFYHAGEGRLRCAWCGGELAPFSRFGSLGLPLDVHRMYFPRCEHAASLEASQRSTNISPPTSPTVNTPLVQTSQSSDNLTQSSGAEHNERVLNMGGTWRALGVVSGGARHPQYASLAARLATFERWPADRHQEPRTLAEAGFYHTGTDDQVRCFYCDGGLGKWEAGDTPWSEHAHWFPHCGYVLLVKGQEFVDTSRNRTSGHHTTSSRRADNRIGSSVDQRNVDNMRRRNTPANFPVQESQVEECMESGITLAALGAGLDAARVRRAIARRLRATGVPFNSSEALIDAVLDDQLNEEPWGVSPSRQRLARDILAETLRDFAPRSGIIPSGQWEDSTDTARSQSDTTRSPSPEPTNIQTPAPSDNTSNVPRTTSERVTSERVSESERSDAEVKPPEKKLSLEEENRQLKEARLCKVCMDCEVSVVFLPCGHLVSCSRCGAALDACPLCRGPVRALVRAYLA